MSKLNHKAKQRGWSRGPKELRSAVGSPADVPHCLILHWMLFGVFMMGTADVLQNEGCGQAAMGTGMARGRGQWRNGQRA